MQWSTRILFGSSAYFTLFAKVYLNYLCSKLWTVQNLFNPLHELFKIRTPDIGYICKHYLKIDQS